MDSVLSGSGDEVGSDCPSVTGSVCALLLVGNDLSDNVAGSEVVGSVVADSEVSFSVGTVEAIGSVDFGPSGDVTSVPWDVIFPSSVGSEDICLVDTSVGSEDICLVDT